MAMGPHGGGVGLPSEAGLNPVKGLLRPALRVCDFR